MALNELLDLSTGNQKKIGLSEDRIEAVKEDLRKYFAFWREYPDLFVDFMQTGGRPVYYNDEGRRCYKNDKGEEVPLTFNLLFYQRVFLRVSMRYKYVYCVYPRAYSKSFLSVMVQMIRAILYPGAQLFTTAGGKEQAAQILQQKIEDICNKIPAFSREIDWRRGKTQMGKDHCKIVFKNGSSIENVAARESSRGLRKHGGVLEECVGIDQDMLQQVIIPLMNVSRRCMDGTVQEDEVLNQSQVYITTAGYKNTFSYNKLIQTLVQMIIDPSKAYVMGGTWRIPVVTGLQSRNFINDLKRDSTFNEAAFNREYESIWSGTVEDAFYDGERFDKNRILNQPEYEYSGRSNKSAYYVLGCDVGRKGCSSEVAVLKVTPQPQGPSIKSLVNLISLDNEHFEDQAIALKKLFYKYKAKRLVLDGNGLGIGLLDYMVKPQIDPDTGDIFPDFGVYGGTTPEISQEYKKFKSQNCEEDAIYVMKANATINTEAHSALQTALSSGKLKFLIDDKDAKAKLLGTKMGQAMTPEKRNEYLLPFVMTSILKEQLLNLREENEGVNIILKRANKAIPKDKFSALEYGIYYIKQEEDTKKRKKKFNAAEWRFFN